MEGVQNGKEGRRTVQAVETTLDIIDKLSDEVGMTATELAQSLDMSTSAAHSHLQTLENRGYVVRDDYSYRPSLRFYSIGERVKRDHLDVYNAGHDPVQELVGETGEYGWIMVEEGGEGLYIYKQRGKNAVETGNFPLGCRAPLHCTAAGKAIMAHLPDDRVHEILDARGLARITPNTTTEEEALFEELADVRERGYALSSEESVQGIRSVAAPVKAVDEDILGAVSISGPVSRIKGERFRETLPEQLIECSNIIEINVIKRTSEFTY